MKRKKMILIIALPIIILISSIIIFNIFRNAPFYKIESYICEKYSIVKSVEFKNARFYSHPFCWFTIYVESDCSYEQAKVIFEDFVTHFSDELIQWLHDEIKEKDFLDVDFTNEKTNLRMYLFQTADTENFIHWEAVETTEKIEPYAFERRSN